MWLKGFSIDYDHISISQIKNESKMTKQLLDKSLVLFFIFLSDNMWHVYFFHERMLQNHQTGH